MSSGTWNRMAKASQKIRLLLADDHPVVREGIRSCLARFEELEVVGEAANGVDVVTKAKLLHPDLVLMDIHMPMLNGLEATDRLRNENPRIRVLALTVYESREYVARIVRAGAGGYVLKDASPEELRQAIRSVAAGHAFFSPRVVTHALNDYVSRADPTAPPELPNLSKRERDVLARIADGLTNKQIAQSLNLSVRTVETHRERIMRKLGIHSVAGLTKYAIANKLTLADMDG
ncbi:MAG: response regulator transcription factor [Verrucomicrobia bacterium]|nr:response regulator transcription factor [Verrucomicrobiota bacterium]